MATSSPGNAVAKNDVVEVSKSFGHPGGGYITVDVGAKVDVLYVGQSGDEEGWLYVDARQMSQGDPAKAKGWLPLANVRSLAQAKLSPTPSAPSEPKVPWKGVVRRDVKAVASGYMEAKAGESVNVLYSGSTATQDQEWLYASSEATASSRGWIERDAVCLPEQAPAGPDAGAGGSATGSSASHPSAFFKYTALIRSDCCLKSFVTGPAWSQEEYKLCQNDEVTVISQEGDLAKVVVQTNSKLSGYVSMDNLRQLPESRTTQHRQRSVGAAPRVPPQPTRPVPFAERQAAHGGGAEVAQTCGVGAGRADVSRPGGGFADVRSRARSLPASRHAAPQQQHHQQYHQQHAVVEDAEQAWQPPPITSHTVDSYRQPVVPSTSSWCPPPQPQLHSRAHQPAPPPLKQEKSSLQVPLSWQESSKGTSGRVVLITFGLENCDSCLVDRCCSAGGGAHIVFEDRDLHAALARRRYPKVDVISDARDFPDPDAMWLTRHTGHNHAIIGRIVSHRNFPRWLQRVHGLWSHALMEALRGRGRGEGPLELTVATYCRSGKHRSVATSLILAFIFRKLKWSCDEPEHLSRPRWGKNVCKGACEECRNPPPGLQDVYNRAYEIWMQLG